MITDLVHLNDSGHSQDQEPYIINYNDKKFDKKSHTRDRDFYPSRYSNVVEDQNVCPKHGNRMTDPPPVTDEDGNRRYVEGLGCCMGLRRL